VSDTEGTPVIKKSKIFYGYWIIAVSALCLGTFSGSGVASFSLFVNSLQSEFGWGRGEIMLAFTIFYLLTGLAAPLVGGIVDRYGVRGVISFGALVTGLGFVSLYMLESLWLLYVAYFFIGTGMAAFGHVPASAMVSNWFVKKRGTAIGIMSTGIGMGIFAVAPLVGGFLIPFFGWRVAYLALGIMAWGLIPLAIFVVRTKPVEMGLYPDGVTSPEEVAEIEASSQTTKGLDLRAALGTMAFWLVSVTFFASAFSSLGFNQSLVPYLQDAGFSVALAASALTIMGLGSAIGKFSFGWLCDKIKAKQACALSLALLSVAAIILMFIGSTSPLAIIWLDALIFGLGAGGWLPTMSMLISRNFGLASYGTIIGMVSLLQAIGGAAGPLLSGYMFDTTNTYYWTFIVFLCLYAVAIPAVLAVRRPKSFV
jgi:MFS family permease